MRKYYIAYVELHHGERANKHTITFHADDGEFPNQILQDIASDWYDGDCSAGEYYEIDPDIAAELASTTHIEHMTGY